MLGCFLEPSCARTPKECFPKEVRLELRCEKRWGKMGPMGGDGRRWEKNDRGDERTVHANTSGMQ